MVDTDQQPPVLPWMEAAAEAALSDMGLSIARHGVIAAIIAKHYAKAQEEKAKSPAKHRLCRKHRRRSAR